MRLFRFILLVVFLVATGAHAGLWTDNYPRALQQAQAENKIILLDFTGSDWCGWCKKLDAEVFSKKAFESFAKSNLVCVKVDFPRGFNLPNKTVRQNAELARRHQVQGYPTIVLLTPDEKLIGHTGYRPDGADAYVKHLEELVAQGRLAAPTDNSTAGPDDKAPAVAQAETSGEFRTWTSTQGVKVDARLEQRIGDTLYLRTRDDKMLKIQANVLSPADRAHLYAPRKP